VAHCKWAFGFSELGLWGFSLRPSDGIERILALELSGKKAGVEMVE
jgi:hypothetical protein